MNYGIDLIRCSLVDIALCVCVTCVCAANKHCLFSVHLSGKIITCCAHNACVCLCARARGNPGNK